MSELTDDYLLLKIERHEATIKEQAEEIVEQKRVSQIQREVASQQRLTHNRLSVELDDLTKEMSDVCETSLAQKVDAIKLRDEIEQLKAALNQLCDDKKVAVAELRAEIDRLRSGIIQIGSAALLKRPFSDSESTKKELVVQVEQSDEALRMIGINCRKLYDTIHDKGKDTSPEGKTSG